MIKCTADNKEYTVRLEYEDAYIPYTLLPQLGDVTGDKKADLIVNVRINGNTLCEELSDTYIFQVNNNELKEILYIAADGLKEWNPQYEYNLGCNISVEGEVLIKACEPMLYGGEMGKIGSFVLRYIDGQWCGAEKEEGNS